MTEAVSVRRDGDTFQARIFWLRAARMLVPDSPIIRVAFETGPKSFDDVWTEYAPSQGLVDQYGVPLVREHLQCKWHVAPDQYGYAQIADPEFINANARSLLQRAHDAQRSAGGAGVRFKLVTNWTVDRNDPLKALIGLRSGTLRHNRLFDDSTDRSKVGGVRKLWREHLATDDEELKALAGALAFGQASDTLDDLRELLDLIFQIVGMRRFSPSESVFPYDDLIFQWMAQGRLEFDRAALRDGLQRENLLATSAPSTISIGVKSFEHPIDPLELQCPDVLDLTADFDDRFIRAETDWASDLYPRLATFLRQAARDHDQLKLALDAHATLAFAAGSVLDLKSGRAITIEQRSKGRELWSADDRPPAQDWPKLATSTIDGPGGGADLALAVGFTHDIAADVSAYVEANLSSVSQILICSPEGGARADSIRCGRHAFDLSQQIVAKGREIAGGARVHLFLAAPNALSFFVGQRRPLLGPTTLYEFDFEGARDRTYRASLSLPFKASP